MRFGFVTCVQLGLSCMEAIYEIDGRLDFALTLEDGQAVGKSGRVWIDDFCARHGIPLAKARNVNNGEALDAIMAAELDWLFIIGWSQIAGDQVLATPRLGVLGMHPSLLPVGRGRAAIPWAILHCLERTGVTLFRMDSGVDTGAIIDQLEIPMRPDITATELYDRVEAAHVALMQSAYPMLQAGTVQPRVQDETRATTWPGRRPDEGRIDPDSSVHDAERLVRAVTRPYPGAFVEREGRKIIIWRAEVAKKGDEGSGFLVAFKDGVLRGLDIEDGGAA